jgi:surface polysaccharide O-acyltransferase-like enzyme
VKLHTVSVLNISVFYLTAFLLTRPPKPVKNFSISSMLLFLSSAVYELVYGVFLDWGSLKVTIPLVVVGAGALFFLNRRFHFLVYSRQRSLLFLSGFACLVAVMFALNGSGFFEEMRLCLNGRTAKDPHNLLWMLSKTVGVWMFLPLLSSISVKSRTGEKQRSTLS